MHTTAICFPFDLFGGGGTAAGALALADALRDILADSRRETARTRALAYRGKVRLRELAFETVEAYHDWRTSARSAARPALRKRQFLLWLSGNHLGVLPVYEELAAGADTVVVQFDAHLDIQNFADSTTEASHGNFLLHARGPLPAVINVGCRDLLLRREYVRRHYRRVFPAGEWEARRVEVLGELVEACLPAARVFFDLDCDVFDQAFFPAVAILQVLPFPTIGGLGVREGALVLFLGPLGVSQAQAIALGLLVYGVNLAVSLLGAPAFAVGRRRMGAAAALTPAGA